MMEMSTASPGKWPAIVAAARDCVGTRFRAQGRVPGIGLDCVGVVLAAAAAVGVKPARLPSYWVGGDCPDVEAILKAEGCTPTSDALPGDVMVFAPSSRQRHFGIVTPLGLVHAHAGLARVVEGPTDRDWTIVSCWRLPGAR